MKTLRELVEEATLRHIEFLNRAVYYDDPQPIPDLSSMTDEELWKEYNDLPKGAIG